MATSQDIRLKYRLQEPSHSDKPSLTPSSLAADSPPPATSTRSHAPFERLIDGAAIDVTRRVHSRATAFLPRKGGCTPP